MCSYHVIMTRNNFSIGRFGRLSSFNLEDESCFGARGAKMTDILSVCCSGTVGGVPVELLADREGHRIN